MTLIRHGNVIGAHHAALLGGGEWSLPTDCEVHLYGNNTEGDGDWTDHSGNDRHAALSGDAAVSSGYLDLDGTGDYATITGYKGVLGNAASHPRSVAFWIKTSNTGETIIEWGSEGGNGYLWQVRTNFEIQCNLVNCWYKTDGTIDVDDGDWHHVVIASEDRDAADGDFLLYVDNTDVGARDGNKELDTQSNNDVSIGYSAVGSDEHFTGQLDDVMIFSKMLTTTEIANIYNNSPGTHKDD